MVDYSFISKLSINIPNALILDDWTLNEMNYILGYLHILNVKRNLFYTAKLYRNIHWLCHQTPCIAENECTNALPNFITLCAFAFIHTFMKYKVI